MICSSRSAFLSRERLSNRGLTRSNRAVVIGILALATSSTLGVRTSGAAVETWDPANTGASGGSGTWDNTSLFWDSGTNTGATATTFANTNNAVFGGTAGTVTVAPAGIQVGLATFTTAGYTLSGGPITFTGSAPELYSTYTGAGSLTVNSVLAGTNGLKIAANGFSTGTIVLNGANTYTGLTSIQAVSLYIPSLANGGTPSALGAGTGTAGYVQLGSSGSTMHLVITTGSSATDRLFQFVGTSTEDIINNGSGSVSFNNTGQAAAILSGGSASVRKLQFDSTLLNATTLTTGTNINYFAEQLSDLNTSAGSLTSVLVDSGSWALTNSNNFTGGTTVASGSQVIINNASSLGAGPVTSSGIGTIAAVSGMTLTNPITANTNATANLYNFTTVGGVGNTLVVSGLISGAGGVRLQTPSSSLAAPIELTNDSNSFTGLFSTGYGFFQYTSVANSGTPSSLGAGTIGGGSGTISIQNGGSFVTFQYVGANVDSTNRPLTYTGYGSSGNLSLDSSGAGAVQFLAANPIRNGISTIANTNTIFLSGTSTGNNVLAQTINDNATTVANSSTTYVGGVTSVTKQGAGMWILTGTSTYTGPTTINGGNLTVDASDAAATLTGVTANAGASIANSGTVTVATAGTLHLLNTAAVSSVSMLSTTSLVSVVTGAKTLLDLNGQTQTIGTFVVNGQAQNAGVYGSAYYFANLPSPPTSLTAEQLADETFFGTTSGNTDGTNGAFNVTFAPEPSTLAIVGIGFGGLLRRRRRNSPSA